MSDRVMQKKIAVAEAFLAELRALLNKYGATLEAKDHYQGRPMLRTPKPEQKDEATPQHGVALKPFVRLVAFRVEVPGWPESAGIYAVRSASKARYRAYCGACEAGYELRLPDLRVRRAPEFDAVMSQQKEGTGWTLDHAKAMLAMYKDEA